MHVGEKHECWWKKSCRFCNMQLLSKYLRTFYVGKNYQNRFFDLHPLSVNYEQKIHRPGISCSVICGQKPTQIPKKWFLRILWSVIWEQKFHINNCYFFVYKWRPRRSHSCWLFLHKWRFIIFPVIRLHFRSSRDISKWWHHVTIPSGLQIVLLKWLQVIKKLLSMYDVIRTKDVTSDFFCLQMMLHDVPKTSQIGIK